MFYSNDPLADFNRYDREQAKQEAELPHCDYCEQVIYDSYYNINSETICKDCLDNNFKVEL